MIKQIYSATLIPLSLLVIFLTGCTKTVTNIKLPSSDPKLVVGCFISPQDTMITVTLTRSNPVFGSNQGNANETVPDASVVISNSTSSSSIPFNNMNMKYQLSTNTFPITAGQTYSLTISTPKGENVSASCTVPPSTIASITVDCIDTAAAISQKKLNVKWNDIPNETNYYRAIASLVEPDTATGHDKHYSIYDEYSLKNDVGKDGKEFISKMTGYYYPNATQSKLYYHIYVMNVDIEYYKYQHSLDNYTYQDPFSEPSPLYTNIKGGLGIFAAYQKIYKKIP